MIRHTVAFRLKWPQNSSQELEFFDAARRLATLPNVQRFECLRQVSDKNRFSYGFSMEFADQTAYSNYSNHPLHLAFVEDYWLRDVEDFMEIDYILLT